MDEGACFLIPRVSERCRHRNNTSYSPIPKFSTIILMLPIASWKLGDLETIESPYVLIT